MDLVLQTLSPILVLILNFWNDSEFRSSPNPKQIGIVRIQSNPSPVQCSSLNWRWSRRRSARVNTGRGAGVDSDRSMRFFAGAGAGTGVGILNKNRIRSRSGFFSFYRSQIIAFNKFKFSLIIKIPNDWKQMVLPSADAVQYKNHKKDKRIFWWRRCRQNVLISKNCWIIFLFRNLLPSKPAKRFSKSC